MQTEMENKARQQTEMEKEGNKASVSSKEIQKINKAVRWPRIHS